MRVAIVDDEVDMRQQLSEYVRHFSDEVDIALDVVCFPSGDTLLEDYKGIYDIIILDIDMPGTNGMDTARAIREVDDQVTLIFVTNIAQYAINGYEVDAVDYIIKPIGYYDFSMKFHRTISKAAQRQEKVVYIDTQEGRRRLKVNDIQYVEVLSHYLFFHLEDNSYKARGSMQNVEGELEQYGFVRIHRSYMINIRFVEKLLSKEVTVAGQVFNVGRTYRENLKNQYLKYIRGES